MYPGCNRVQLVSVARHLHEKIRSRTSSLCRAPAPWPPSPPLVPHNLGCTARSCKAKATNKCRVAMLCVEISQHAPELKISHVVFVGVPVSNALRSLRSAGRPVAVLHQISKLGCARGVCSRNDWLDPQSVACVVSIVIRLYGSIGNCYSRWRDSHKSIISNGPLQTPRTDGQGSTINQHGAE